MISFLLNWGYPRQLENVKKVRGLCGDLLGFFGLVGVDQFDYFIEGFLLGFGQMMAFIVHRAGGAEKIDDAAVAFRR